MRVDGAVQHMTKQNLDRVIDSFTKDFPKLDEAKARDAITRNVDDLTDDGRIGRQLSFDGARYPDRVLQSFSALSPSGHRPAPRRGPLCMLGRNTRLVEIGDGEGPCIRENHRRPPSTLAANQAVRRRRASPGCSMKSASPAGRGSSANAPRKPTQHGSAGTCCSMV